MTHETENLSDMTDVLVSITAVQGQQERSQRRGSLLVLGGALLVAAAVGESAAQIESLELLEYGFIAGPISIAASIPFFNRGIQASRQLLALRSRQSCA